MNELLITNADNSTSKSYAVYYTNNERYYVIYTEKEKDENDYVVLHIAKVLKEVNSTPDGGVVPTGRFIGLEISDQSEWDAVKADIGAIVSNLQSDTPVNVNYLPVSEISGISIKSSKTFKLRDDVVDAIIKEEIKDEPVAVVEEIPSVEINEPMEIPTEPVPSIPEQPEPVLDPAPMTEAEPVLTPQVESVDAVPADLEPAVVPLDNLTTNFDGTMPAVAPNPFEFTPIPTEDFSVKVEEEEEEVVPNPYEELQQKRAEEMISNLATDAMQDIVPEPVLSVDTIENSVASEPEIAPVEIPTDLEPVVPVEPEVVETAAVDLEPVISVDDVQAVEPLNPATEVVIEESNVEQAPQEVATVEEEPVEEEQEIVSSESFVDSIVADVTDILDTPAQSENDDNSNYKQLYHEELEKTIELEKELKELHNKLNNIKNIIE